MKGGALAPPFIGAWGHPLQRPDKRRELLLGLGIDHPILAVIDRRHICEHQLHIDPGNPPQQVIPLPMEVGTHSTLHPPRTAQTANARSHSIGRSPRVSSRPVPFINLFDFLISRQRKTKSHPNGQESDLAIQCRCLYMLDIRLTYIVFSIIKIRILLFWNVLCRIFATLIYK